ncbi:MAG: (2Fe-2S)-binding protein [Proteobacteria bacterium]|nr:(2Fe-2S)-binding protein [Pseudomonadota bacterium]
MQFRRLGEAHRQTVHFFVNGRPAQALAGDTVLTALLMNGARVRASEFGDGPRAGFCNMGACQDCWISLESGVRFRACSEPIRPDLRIVVAD